MLGIKCECLGSSEITNINAPVHSRCVTLKNPHCSMATSAEHRSKCAALHRQWWRLQMSEWKILEWNEKLQRNNQTLSICIFLCVFQHSLYFHFSLFGPEEHSQLLFVIFIIYEAFLYISHTFVIILQEIYRLEFMIYKDNLWIRLGDRKHTTRWIKIIDSYIKLMHEWLSERNVIQ